MQKPTVRMIRLDDIDEGDRKRTEYGDLSELTDSLLELGVLQSLSVVEKSALGSAQRLGETDPSKPYLLATGGRRYKALYAGRVKQPEAHVEVPALVYTHLIGEDEFRAVELTENLYRKDLTWLEHDQMTAELHRLNVAKHGETMGGGGKTGHKQEDTAKLLGVSRAAVSASLRRVALVEANPEIAKASTRQEAERIARKNEEQAVIEEVLRRHKAKKEALGDAGVETERKRLVANYILKPVEEGAKEIPNGSIDFIDFDPPYAVHLEAVKKGEASVEEYVDIPDDAYEEWMRARFADFHRVMKDNAWGICWFSPKWFRILDWLRDAGFTTTHNPLLWHKPGSQGQTQNPVYLLGNAYEQAFYFRKGTIPIRKQGRSNVFSHKALHPSRMIHPAERPLALIEDILNTFCVPNARIWVPCLGSGKTIMAASNCKMQAFGHDIVETYRNDYALRIITGTPGAFLDPTSDE